MTVALTLAAFTIGLYAGSIELVQRYRNLKAIRALLHTTRSKHLRQQIRAQHAADEACRRALTVDPWLGRGGQYVFWPQISIED